MARSHRLVAIVLAVLGTASMAWAQPANDDCANATVIGALPFTDTVDISTATTEPGDLSCFDPGGELGGTAEPLSAWYRYTATDDVILSVETSNTVPNFSDASIVALGSCGALELLNCNANTGSATQITTATVRAGTTVYLAVVEDDIFSPTGGSVQIDVTATPVVSPTPLHTGADFQVNVVGTSYQEFPDVEVAADGSFVVVWQTEYVSGGDDGVMLRRFDAAAAPLTGDVLVNTYTTESQEEPAVGMAPDGSFVVVWQSYRQDGGFYDGIFGQRFGGAAAPAGSEFQVSTYTSEGQIYPDVAVDAAGNFLVVWQSLDQDGDDWGVFGRAFDGTGTPAGAEFQVNVHTTDVQSYPAAAADPGGGFVVVWHSYAQDGDDYGVFARRYDAAGAPLGSEFQVNDATSNSQQYPSVAGHPDGGVFVAWEGPDLINFRRFDAAGAAVTGDLAVSAEEYPERRGPKIAGNPAGDFVIVWPHTSDYDKLDPDRGVSGQRLESDGTLAGAQFQVNAYTVGSQKFPAVSVAGDSFVVAFTDYTEFPGRDGSGVGVFAQRFELPPLAPIVGVKPTKLIIVDKTAIGSGAKVVYVSKDQAAGITKGTGEDVANVSARFDLTYDSAVGAFLAPAGALVGTTGWTVNKLAVAKYVNKAAGPAPAAAIKVTVLKTGKLVKVVAKGLGDGDEIDLFVGGEPDGPVASCYEIDNGGERFRFGSTWAPGDCQFKEIAGGAGRKLVCKGGAGDATCSGAP